MSFSASHRSDSYITDGVSSITNIDVAKNLASNSIYSLQVSTSNGFRGRPVPDFTYHGVPAILLKRIDVPACATLTGFKVWTTVQTQFSCTGVRLVTQLEF
jgi:hypothetical protein